MLNSCSRKKKPPRRISQQRCRWKGILWPWLDDNAHVYFDATVIRFCTSCEKETQNAENPEKSIYLCLLLLMHYYSPSALLRSKKGG